MASQQNERARTHPNGKRYIKINQVQTVHGLPHDIPPSCYGRGKKWNSSVTPEQVDAASDQYDAWGVWEEAKTAFGLRPEGDAFDTDSD